MMYDLPFELPVGWKVFSVEELVREKNYRQAFRWESRGDSP
jgi:hypothetical protein